MLVEMLGVQLPGASFVSPDSPLREALTRSGRKINFISRRQALIAPSTMSLPNIPW